MPVNDFKRVEDISEFKVMKDIFLEVDVHYPENIYNLHNDLNLWLERMKIQKAEKRVANLNDKEEYVIRIRKLKQAFNHGLVLKKVHRVIKFNQKTWLKPYFDRNTDLAKPAKMILKNTFLSC